MIEAGGISRHGILPEKVWSGTRIEGLCHILPVYARALFSFSPGRGSAWPPGSLRGRLVEGEDPDGGPRRPHPSIYGCAGNRT
ncbi:hypothetical protein ApDm4_2480 [Acetobacter pomorum]|nr:hypothetical protein ApDm4_2480 [Acetobacter pomorum]